MQPKVLIGIITYAGEKHCREAFVQSIKNFSYTNFEILVVTNSGEEDKADLEKVFTQLDIPVSVFVNEEHFENTIDQITSNRNVLREHALAKEWEYFFSLDSDVLCPSNVIDLLLDSKKPISSGVYLSFFKHPQETKAQVLPIVFVGAPNGGSRQAALIDVLIPRIFPAHIVGLGCVLFPREYLEKISFRRIEKAAGTGGEDTAFFLDCAKEFDEFPWVNTHIQCKHEKFEDAAKNVYLDPSRYQLQKARK